MENHDELKIAKIKTLDTLHFNTNINILIDSNVNIGSIVDIEAYTYDEKIDCASGHASLSGRIGVKVVYVDTDNILNTISDSVPFNEVYSNPAITNTSNITITGTIVEPKVISSDGVLKISLDCSISMKMFLSLGLNTSIGSVDGLVTKKKDLHTFLVNQIVNTSFEYTQTIETTDSVSKVLSICPNFALVGLSAEDSRCVVDGRLNTTIIYENQTNDSTSILQTKSTDTIKLDLAIEGLSKEDILDLSFAVEPNKTKFEVDNSDTGLEISVTTTIAVSGVVLSPIEVEVVDDVYSCTNEIQYSTSKREYLSACKTNVVSEKLSSEFVLEDKPPVDEIVGVTNSWASLIQVYQKDNSIILEGVVKSNVIYRDEEQKYYGEVVETPFVIDTKTNTNQLDTTSISVSIQNIEAKAKHQDTIALELELSIYITSWDTAEQIIVDNVVIGKPIEYKDVDYQIFVAREGETSWDICKRARTNLDDMLNLNKDLPEIMTGGEKIVVKR